MTALPEGAAFVARVPVVLVLDVSGSMALPKTNRAIDELNAEILRWLEHMRRDASLAASVDMAVVTFATDVTVVDPIGQQRLVSGVEAFAPVGEIRLPDFTAGGLTLMRPAIETALAMVEARKGWYKAQGLPYKRPLIWMLTDGVPSDEHANEVTDCSDMAALVKQAVDARRCLFFALGTRNANEAVLRQIVPEGAFLVQDLDYGAVLRIVSASFDRLSGGGDPYATVATLIVDELRRKRLGDA